MISKQKRLELSQISCETPKIEPIRRKIAKTLAESNHDKDPAHQNGASG
jgi:hypothetical protein